MKVEYETFIQENMNTGNLKNHMGNLHWNGNIWYMDEPSNHIQQGIGWKWTKQAVLTSLVLICNSVKLLSFQLLSTPCSLQRIST